MCIASLLMHLNIIVIYFNAFNVLIVQLQPILQTMCVGFHGTRAVKPQRRHSNAIEPDL